jgi:hypothetical protein
MGFVVIPPGNVVKNLWIPAGYGHTLFSLGAYDIIGTTGVVSFIVPPDLNEFISADWGFHNAGAPTSGTASFTLDSEYGNPDNGEAYNTSTETNAGTYSITLGKLFRISILPVVTGVSAGDHLNVRITNGAGGSVYQTGLLVRYR